MFLVFMLCFMLCFHAMILCLCLFFYDMFLWYVFMICFYAMRLCYSFMLCFMICSYIMFLCYVFMICFMLCFHAMILCLCFYPFVFYFPFFCPPWPVQKGRVLNVQGPHGNTDRNKKRILWGFWFLPPLPPPPHPITHLTGLEIQHIAGRLFVFLFFRTDYWFCYWSLRVSCTIFCYWFLAFVFFFVFFLFAGLQRRLCPHHERSHDHKALIGWER